MLHDDLEKGDGQQKAGRKMSGKTAKMLGLFMAVTLAATAGCGAPQHAHIDRNGDGYCDEDGERVGTTYGSRGYGGYYSSPYLGGQMMAAPGTPSTSAGISSGTHGGIGGSSVGSGG